MTESDRDAPLAWAARRLAWERRLRELEAVAAAPAVEPAAQPAADSSVEPAVGARRRPRAGGSRILRNV